MGRRSLLLVLAAVLIAILVGLLAWIPSGSNGPPEPKGPPPPSSIPRLPASNPPPPETDPGPEEDSPPPPVEDSEPEKEVENALEPRFDLRVTVLASEDRDPIPDATVRVLHKLSGEARTRVTDAAGVSQFTDLADFDWVIEVKAEGRVPEEARSLSFRRHRPGAGRLESLEILLSPGGGRVHGRVVGLPQGDPVVGAEVGVQVRRARGSFSSWRADREALSGADGAFAFDDLPGDKGYRVRASATGWTTESRSVPFPEEVPEGDHDPVPGREAPLVIELRPAGRVRGFVKGPDNSPVGGANVVVLEKEYARFVLDDLNRGSTHLSGFREIPSARTDGDGRYEVSHVPAGEGLTVVAYGPQYSPSDPVEGIGVPPGPSGVEVNLVLKPDTGLVVRILGPDGKPPAGDTGIWISGDTWGRTGTIRNGVGVFKDVPPGILTLNIDSDRFADVVERVKIPEGSVVERVLHLEPGVSLSGVLVDEDGSGVAGVEVIASFSEDWKGPGPAGVGGKAMTGQEGEFEIGGLRPGPHDLILDEGSWRSVGTIVAPTDGIRLHVGGGLRFRIVPPAGAALPGGAKEVLIRVRLQGEEAWIHTSGAQWSPEGSSQDRDSPSGVMFVERVRPGNVEVEVRVNGFAPQRRTVRVPSGGQADLGDIHLDRGMILRGRVQDESGDPVPGTTIRVEYEDGSCSVSVQAGDDGAFLLPGLVAGSGVLWAAESWDAGDRFVTALIPITVTAGMPAFDITLRPGVVLRVRVLHSDGRPVKMPIVYGLPMGSPETLLRPFGGASEDGVVRARLLPGTWEVRAHPVGMPGILVRGEVDVVTGENPTLELRLDD